MEEGHQSSRTIDQQPLEPPSPQRPLSEEFSEDPATSHYIVQGVPNHVPGHRAHEEDIADHGAQLDEKSGRISPRRPIPDFRANLPSSLQDIRTVDWILPEENGGAPEHESMRRWTVEESLESTLAVAKVEHIKYARRGQIASLSVNIAMFAQIVVNALVTGFAAAPSNRKIQIGVSALGATGTILASFVARLRGTREPERSMMHSHNLEKFIRELEAFILDEGPSRNPKWDETVNWFRVEFDKLQMAAHRSKNGHPTSSECSSKMGEAKSTPV